MTNNQCLLCGQFSGKGHKCPPPGGTPVYEPKGRPAGSPIPAVPGPDVDDRVSRARAVIDATTHETGTTAFRDLIHDVTGKNITDEEWEELQRITAADAFRKVYFDRNRDLPMGDSKERMDAAHAEVEASGLMSNSIVSTEEIAAARDRILGSLQHRADAQHETWDTERMRAALTRFQGNGIENIVMRRRDLSTLNGITDRGLDNSLYQARNALKGYAINDQARADVLAAADTETDPKIAEGLRIAASKITTKGGDYPATQWANSDEAREAYPGLTAKLREAVRGERDAQRMQMYSRAANEAVLKEARAMQADIRSGKLKRKDVSKRIRAIQKSVSKEYDEVYDTEPRGALYDFADAAGSELGWDRIPED